MGAVQAQDYGGARWAVAQRSQGLTGADLDAALAAGNVVRTHVLRPTWHLVSASDLRWLLALTAPRVKTLAAYGNRQSGLDPATIAKSNRVIAAAVQGHQLTRAEMAAGLRRAGVLTPDAIGIGRLLLAAELDGVICSGAVRGTQHTHALLDERVPPSAAKDRDTALADLSARYFASHGPATIKDFAWWSGLSVSDARRGAHAAQPPLESVDMGATTYWMPSGTGHPGSPPPPMAHLLPNFDEYTVGYSDRSLLIDGEDIQRLSPRPDVISNNVVVVNGRIVGTWRRQARTHSIRLSLSLFSRPTKPHDVAITEAVERYAAFVGQPVDLDRGYSDP
ncbi:MAG: winged helix DNA-binding domain-containing protein [Candidatus Dormibacteraeota bacterium]|nr:winged helix DNA-binding domain-containing protein [Candidatus Dormibacteraeota bacterium]